MNGKHRKSIKPGLKERITQKPDQHNKRIIGGIVKDVLTTSTYHPHGIKVRLEPGEVGRVQAMVGTGHEAEAAERGRGV